MKVKTMVICAIFAAILCVFSVLTIPIGPVPISMGILGVMLTAIILGPKKGTIAVIVYILLGAVGLRAGLGDVGAVGGDGEMVGGVDDDEVLVVQMVMQPPGAHTERSHRMSFLEGMTPP